MFLKKPTQNHLDHKPSIKTFVAAVFTQLSATVTMVCLATFAPGLWSRSLTGNGCGSKTPSLPSCVPYFCWKWPPQWLHWEKRFAPFPCTELKGRSWHFLLTHQAVSCKWMRSTYPAGSLVAGDLWQRVRLTAMATASAASSPKIIVIIFFLWRCAEEELSAVAVQVWPPSASCF